MNPEVEFFSEDVDGVEYLNVGLVWGKSVFDDDEGVFHMEEQRAVLGAFSGKDPIDQNGMSIIKGLVEQACLYVMGLEE